MAHPNGPREKNTLIVLKCWANICRICSYGALNECDAFRATRTKSDDFFFLHISIWIMKMKSVTEKSTERKTNQQKRRQTGRLFSNSTPFYIWPERWAFVYRVYRSKWTKAARARDTTNPATLFCRSECRPVYLIGVDLLLIHASASGSK